MLLENVRTLDEAVEEVREDKRQKEIDSLRRREHDRLERARVKAINRSHRGWPRGGGGRQVELPSGSAPVGGQAGAEPAIEATMEAAELPVRSRPALSPVRGEASFPSGAIDLTAEDDTMTLPKLDSLERKLADLERQYG
jgi:hypothetical protein